MKLRALLRQTQLQNYYQLNIMAFRKSCYCYANVVTSLRKLLRNLKTNTKDNATLVNHQNHPVN